MQGMTKRATHALTAIAISSTLLAACEAPPPAPTPALTPPPTTDAPAPPAPVAHEKKPEPDAAGAEPVAEKAVVPAEPVSVTAPEKAILGAWRGIAFESKTPDDKAATKLASTMLLQFSESSMKVTVGPLGAVEGPWKVVKKGVDTLTIQRMSPEPAQVFAIRFHGPHEITMKVSSRQTVRYARVRPPQAGQAPAAPPAPREKPPK